MSTAPLTSLIPENDSFPAVVDTEPLNEIEFPNPGARRRVQLADGGSALEEVIENRPNEYFSYKVWGYTLDAARPIEYGKGEFWYLPEGNGSATTLHWRYSFNLRRNRFPGVLGPLGRFLFTKMFLDRSYAAFMKSSMRAIETYVSQPEAR